MRTVEDDNTADAGISLGGRLIRQLASKHRKRACHCTRESLCTIRWGTAVSRIGGAKQSALRWCDWQEELLAFFILDKAVLPDSRVAFILSTPCTDIMKKNALGLARVRPLRA